MSYRLLKLTTVYEGYADVFFGRNPDASRLSYEDLLARFIATRYALSDAYAFHLRRLGRDAAEVFASLRPLQQAWAREHGLEASGQTWLGDIVLAQIKAYRPDVVYLQDLYVFDREFRARVRAECGSVRAIVGWRAAPTADFAEFRDLDLLFTASPGMLAQFRAAGVRSEYVPLGFDDRAVVEAPAPAERNVSLSFAGQVSARNGWFAERGALLERMLTDSPLEVWGATPPPRSMPKRVAQMGLCALNRTLVTLGVADRVWKLAPMLGRYAHLRMSPWPLEPYERHHDRFHPPVFGLEYYALLASSRVTLNVHIDAVSTHATNLRLYEATGMGACLLTDWKPNLSELFEPDSEVVDYRSAEECAEKARYLLAHDAERRRIAEAGQRRTLRDHTQADRVGRIDSMIVRLLADVRASG